MENEIHFENVPYGFEYGGAKVERLFSDKKKGWVVIGIKSKKNDVQVYVTKTGKIRIYDKDGELKAR